MKTLILSALMLAAPLTAVAPVAAQPYGDPDYRWYGNNRRDWDAQRAYHDDRRWYGHERRLRRDDYVYGGNDGRYYCRRRDGTTGLVIGGVGGALAGGAIGGDALGGIVGAGAGALLGRAVDRDGGYRCR